MDRNMTIRLILTNILTNAEFAEEDNEMYRNSENSMAIALWEGFARKSLALKC